jgi:hypothetical protein
MPGLEGEIIYPSEQAGSADTFFGSDLHRHDCIDLATSALESRRANVSRRNSSHDFGLDQLILGGRDKFFTAHSTMSDHEFVTPS